MVDKVRDLKKANEGFNAQNEEYGDLVEAGVIDPTKVVRTALQNASSIASLLLTTEALVSEIPEEKKGRRAGWRWHARWDARRRHVLNRSHDRVVPKGRRQRLPFSFDRGAAEASRPRVNVRLAPSDVPQNMGSR